MFPNIDKAYLWNNMPHSDIWVSLLGILSSNWFSSYGHIRRLYVFGWPDYVLDKNLQYGIKLPKWIPRYRCGQYMVV